MAKHFAKLPERPILTPEQMQEAIDAARGTTAKDFEEGSASDFYFVLKERIGVEQIGGAQILTISCCTARSRRAPSLSQRRSCGTSAAFFRCIP